jgi:hypothetical protein
MDKGSASTSDNMCKETRYKLCPVRFCNNIGIHFLEVKYIHRYGWFCDHCKESLEVNGLVNCVASKNKGDLYNEK